MQLFTSFYEKSDKQGSPSPGDIYWVPIPQVDETPRIFDVKRSDPQNHDSVEFVVEQIANHHFSNRQDRLPIKLLDLGATEEAILAKAKKRPAIVLFTCGLQDIHTLPSKDKRLAKDMAKACHVVAPCYSPATPSSPGAFMPTLVARIRAMRYPHLSCLPKLAVDDAQPGEIVRLDRLYATHLGRGSMRADCKLHPDIKTLICDQLLWTARGHISEFLQTVIATVADCLPPELAADKSTASNPDN